MPWNLRRLTASFRVLSCSPKDCAWSNGGSSFRHPPQVEGREEEMGEPHFRHEGPLYWSTSSQHSVHIGAVLWSVEGFLQILQETGKRMLRNRFNIKSKINNKPVCTVCVSLPAGRQVCPRCKEQSDQTFFPSVFFSMFKVCVDPWRIIFFNFL